MKLLLINSVIGFGSTGRIVLEIAKEYEQNGYEVKIAYGRNEKCPEEAKKYAVRIGNDIEVYLHVLYTRLTDRHGLASKLATRKFLDWAENYNPDIVWLHNIHGYYINYVMLFDWIKSRPQMNVKWTLHDCWAFTGHCAYFTYVNCKNWCNEVGCRSCCQKNTYPQSFIDKAGKNYLRKRKTFSHIKNLIIITPSEWLASLVKKSFLREYNIIVVKNKIRTNIFKPTDNDFKEKFNITDKIMLLGVANKWEKRKGLDDFIELSTRLDDKYQIVLVGISKNEIKKVPQNVICIPRVKSTTELVQIYSAADVFINPTREENYPTVNLEAEACGTPVITYDTGGCSETVKMDNSIVVSASVDNILKAIKTLRIASSSEG